jgi:hypothetical protein
MIQPFWLRGGGDKRETWPTRCVRVSLGAQSFLLLASLANPPLPQSLLLGGHLSRFLSSPLTLAATSPGISTALQTAGLSGTPSHGASYLNFFFSRYQDTHPIGQDI